MKVIGLMHSLWSCEPGKKGHCDHDALLNSSWPYEVTTQHCGSHHSKQVQKINRSLYVKPASRLHLLSKWAGRFHVFFEKHVLFNEVESDEQKSNDERPLRKQCHGRPMERHAAQESQE